MPFLKANAGKLALVGGLLVAAVGLYAFQGNRAPSRKGKVQFVCVATGESFWFARGEKKILPVESPKNGEKTLLPCHEREDGSLQVSSRCRSLVEEFEQNAINKYVDPETLLVRTSP
jgi:hypothetical protein